MNTSADAPYLDCAYKLQEYEGTPRRKRSEGKATWPGASRSSVASMPAGTPVGDVVALAADDLPGTPLLRPVLRGGRRVGPPAHAGRRPGSRGGRARPAAPALRALDAAAP